MSVLSYLTSLASALVLSSDEKQSISTSLSTLSSRLNYWSKSDEISSKSIFGSYSRETILPRIFDEGSDVDYMIVFKNTNNYQPSTYLGWLKDFAEIYYSRSDIYQSFPTIVLELNHIKFELVPAIYNLWSGYQIPDNNPFGQSWQYTEPFSLKNKITEANKLNGNIRPLIRILKYWNAKNGKPFASFKLEEKIANYAYWSYNYNLEDCFYGVVETLYADYDLSQTKKNAINNLKSKAALAKEYKRQGMPVSAENTIKSIFN